MVTKARTGPAAGLGSPEAKGIDTSRASSADQAAMYIRRLIFDGDLRPGARVPQDDVARTLGVSRIPVREALIALEREGWVTIELHRGAFVDALDADAVRDHFELYGLVYGYAARRALDRSGTSDLFDALDALARSLRRTKDPEQVTQLTLRFHRTVVDAARSPRTKVVLRAMSGLLPGDFFSLVPAAVTVERRGLQAIAAALRAGDADAAAVAYATLMRGVGDQVVRLFERRGLFAAPGA